MQQHIPVTLPTIGRPVRVEGGASWFGYRHARDIPDRLFLLAVVAAQGRRGVAHWATRWDVEQVLAEPGAQRDSHGNYPGVPSKVVLAKIRRLIDRKLLTGCPCGCRGDLELTDTGWELIA